jgi:hypothetical protein
MHITILTVRAASVEAPYPFMASTMTVICRYFVVVEAFLWFVWLLKPDPLIGVS